MELRPKRNVLNKYRTPLLIGGVFGIGILAYILTHYRFIVVPYEHIPSDAVVAITLLRTDADFEKVTTTINEVTGLTIPVTTQQASSLTLFATQNATGTDLIWKIVEQTPTTRFNSVRLIPADSSGIGFVKTMEHGVLPISIELSDERFLAQIGFRMPGIIRQARHPLQHVRLSSIATDTARMYVGLNKHFDTSIIPKTGPVAELVHGMPDNFELVLGKYTEGALLQNFIIKTFVSSAFEANVLEEAIRSTLGELDPHNDIILLEDGSFTTELRSSTKSIASDERIFSGGIIRNYHSPYNNASITIYTDNDGWMWISDSSETLQAFIIGQSSLESNSNDGCIHSAFALNAIIYPQNIDTYTQPLDKWSHVLRLFNSVSYSLSDYETGLFTICGYFK